MDSKTIDFSKGNIQKHYGDKKVVLIFIKENYLQVNRVISEFLSPLWLVKVPVMIV